METGIGEAVQVLNVTINGTSTALRLMGSLAHFSGHELKLLGKFIAARYKESKMRPETMAPGEIDIHEFMRVTNANNESVGCMTVDNSIKDRFIEYAKQYGLSFSTLYQLNAKDETTFLYRESEAYAFQSFIMSEDKARISSISEYTNSITEVDKINADKLLAAPQAYFNEFSSLLNEMNKTQAIPLDNTQIVGQTPYVVEISIMDDEDNVGFVKVPRDAIKYDKVNATFYLNLANSDEFRMTSEPSIIISKEGNVEERVLKTKTIEGEKVRNGVTKRLNSIKEGIKNKTVFTNPDVNISRLGEKTVDTAKNASKTVSEKISNTVKNGISR